MDIRAVGPLGGDLDGLPHEESSVLGANLHSLTRNNKHPDPEATVQCKLQRRFWAALAQVRDVPDSKASCNLQLMLPCKMSNEVRRSAECCA